MTKYGMIQAIFMSFYSKKLYRDVAINWGGKSFLYLLFILALSWIYFTYQLQHGINVFAAKDMDKIVTQIPVMSIKDGKLSTPVYSPYVITDPDTKEKIAVIDTTGQYKSIGEARTPILVTQTEIVTESSSNEIKTYQFPASLSMVVVPQVVNSYLQKFLEFSWIPAFIFLLIFSFIYRLLQALLYSLIGKIISEIANVRLSYGQCLQIVMVAITPALVIATILDVLGIGFKNELLCYFMLSLVYMLFGILANKNGSINMATFSLNK